MRSVSLDVQTLYTARSATPHNASFELKSSVERRLLYPVA